MGILKKKMIPFMFLLAFVMLSLPTSAETMESAKTCLINKSCDFTLRTVNGTGVVNEEVCNITIWNNTQGIVIGPVPMENQTNGFQNYTYVFQATGTYNVGIECIFSGIVEFASQDVVVKEMLENAGLIAMIPLGIAFFFIYLAYYLKGKEYIHLRTFFVLMAITFVWGSLSAGMEIARADAYVNLQLYLRALWYGYTAFMVAFWGLWIYTIFLPKTLEWFRTNALGKKRGIKW